MRRVIITCVLLLLPVLLLAQGWRGSVNGQEIFYGSAARPLTTNTATLGTATVQWLTVYARNVTLGAAGVLSAPFVNATTAYQVGGAAITSGTTYLSSGTGLTVANVGANSCGTTAATIAGNNNANVTTVGTVAGTQCRIAFTVTAATEWDCVAGDSTTTGAVRTTPVDTTHTDLIGTFTAGDKITAICFPR